MAIEYLRRYVKPSPAPSGPGVSDSALARAPSEVVHDLETAIGGHILEGSGGACFIAEVRREFGTTHGPYPFSRLRDVSAERLALICRDPELRYVDLRKAVFLDTETTGLSLGAGTYVFLVGAGYLSEDGFRVRQFFLRTPSREAEFLAALESFLRRFSVIVSFNGKAFDWPLLENRFVGHRDFRRPPLTDPPHIDLLHPARRIWRRRLESCALAYLESSILGVTRTEEDVPGWMIPSLYFTYLRSADATALRRVFYHNLHDILSLAALAVHLDWIVADPMGGALAHASDYLCLSRYYDLAGDSGRAISCLESALRCQPSGEDRGDALIRLAMIHKRERRWDAALPVWDLLVEEGAAPALFALVERAKYYEHVERDFLEALDDVQSALNLAELRGPNADADLRDLEHRRGRLLNRVYRQRSWVGERHAHSGRPNRS
jgi:uncharacterized protein YprB with RNaseH-like and TPR domain